MKLLPISKDLVLLRYDDKTEGKRGYVFFYPSQDSTWLIEGPEENSKDLQNFEDTICQLLYVIH